MVRIWIVTVVAAVVLLSAFGCGQGAREAPPGSADRTSSGSGTDEGGPKPLVLGAKNEEPVPGVVGEPIEAACRALLRAGHAGEVSYIKRAQGVEPGRVLAQNIRADTNKGASMLVYLTVSGPFSERELSPNTSCANPQPDIDDVPPRRSD
jgi:hypothetical protein